MQECNTLNCNNTNLVHSGVDAFMLGGVPTGLYCYTCAAAYIQILNHIDVLKEVTV